METYQEFLNRINSFEKSFDLGRENFMPHPSMMKKVSPENKFLPFYGDTVVFRLSEQEQAFFQSYTDQLYAEAPECFSQRIHANTFHMTLHDLSNAPDLSDICQDMAQNAQKLRALIRQEKPAFSNIHMKYNAVFDMKHIALVIGLYPADAEEYAKLMQLYNLLNQVIKLSYPLTPHITLGYYSRQGFSADAGRKLAEIVQNLNQNSIDILLSPNRLYYQHFTSMAEYQNIFCLEDIT